MRVQYFDSYDAMCKVSAEMVMNTLKQKSNMMLCAATGNSPTGLYREMANAYEIDQSLFYQLRIFKLDEWGDMEANVPASCEYYLQEHVLNPLQIPGNRYIAFQNNPSDPKTECERVQNVLNEQGPIDICVLGLGANGHMGLNEPNKELQPHCHVAQLAELTLSHGMIADIQPKPTYGMTIGIEDILASKHILMLVVGSAKKQATEMLLSGEVTNQFPVTHLQRHANVDCLIVRQEV